MRRNKLFEKLDAQGIEWPDGFDRDLILARVQSMTPALDIAIGQKLEMDSSAQDATFACNLGCVQRPDAEASPEYLICLTFSNFGGLCLLWGQQSWLDDNPGAVSAAMQILLAHDQVLLRAKDVQYPYSGRHSEWHGKTWLDRFFSHY